MVNSDSPFLLFGEKVGIVIGKGIRYAVIGGIIYVFGGKLFGSTPPQPGPNPVPPPVGPPGPPPLP